MTSTNMGGRLVVLSFIPSISSELDDISDIMDNMSPIQCDGILWIKHGPKTSPVLLYENAELVYNYMTWWCGGKYDKWFNVHLIERDGRYGFMLMPNIRRSIDRRLYFRNNEQDNNVRYISSLFDPPMVISISNPHYNSVCGDLSSKFMDIGFMDTEYVENKLHNELIMWARNIIVQNSGPGYDFLLKELEDQ